MRVNINLVPRQDVPYDMWAPMSLGVCPTPNTLINSQAKETLELFKSVSKTENIEIYNNGQPSAWGERIAGILKQSGYRNVSVDPGDDKKYFDKKSSLFPDPKKPYKMFAMKELKSKIEDLFEYYKTREWNIEDSGICGHYYRGRMLWTQVQKGYDPKSSTNEPLMSRMKELLGDIIKRVNDVLRENNTVIEDLESRITLRLLDYVNENKLNSKLGPHHLDATLLTGLLHHDAPSLHIKEYIDEPLTLENAVKKDISQDLFDGNSFLIPGYEYANDTKSYVSPCWHGVQVPTDHARRLSMVIIIFKKFYFDEDKKRYYPEGPETAIKELS